jgi:restriction endonuclease S subunit
MKMVWKLYKLKELLFQIKDKIDLEDNQEYSQVTVSNTGKIKLRGIQKGSQIGTKKQTIVKEGWFIYSRLGVHQGAFGLIPQELDGAIVTGDMPVFKINKKMIFADFLIYALNLPNFQAELIDLTRGLAQTRVREKFFLNIEIKIPDLDEQEKILLKLSNINEKYDLLNNNHLKNENYISKLRQAILSEAVQGKLVPQDPNDEPARVLLEKIKAEKDKLIKEKKIRTEKPLPKLAREEVPYELPKSWEWVRFDNIKQNKLSALKAGPFGSSLKKEYYVEKGYKIYGQEQVIGQDPHLGNYYIDELRFNQLKSCEVEPGDILISLVGTVGKVLILPENIEKGIINPRLVKLSLYKDINSKFIKIFLYSPIAKDMISNYFRGSTMNIINLTILKQTCLPLPPLNEQKRIVEKVDQLMKLCDELEEQVKKNQTNSEKLMNAVLREAFEV